jgi:hypothetical protein
MTHHGRPGKEQRGTQGVHRDDVPSHILSPELSTIRQPGDVC